MSGVVRCVVLGGGGGGVLRLFLGGAGSGGGGSGRMSVGCVSVDLVGGADGAGCAVSGVSGGGLFSVVW